MLNVQEGQEKSNLALIYHFVSRCLAVNRNSSDGVDGVAIINLLIAVLENMQGKVDSDLKDIINILV